MATGQTNSKLYVTLLGGGIQQMTDYRAYLVGDDGHFVGFEPLVCEDDAEAISKAQQIFGINSVEVWSGSRLVIRIARNSEPGSKKIEISN